MKLLVLGASGGVGRWVARLAAERGHLVTAVVREGSRYDAPSQVRVIRGDASDRAVLERAVESQESVLSCLGLRRAGLSPFARLLSPADLTARVTSLLVSVLREAKADRVIVISAGGVGDSFEQLTWPVKTMVSTGNVAVAYRDLAEMEHVLEASSLDWLAVRPVTLVNGPHTGRARPVQRYGLLSIIRRVDVADWMVTAAERPSPLSERRVLLGVGS